MAVVDKKRMQELDGGFFHETACSSDTRTIYPLQRCYWAGRTKICDTVIASSPDYGKILFLDGELQSSEHDEAIYHEHLVHPVLAATAHMHHKNVLLVGGGEGATCREVLKWSADLVAHIDWVDIDGPLVDLCRTHLNYASDDVYNSDRISYHEDDIRQFLHRSIKRYDVILLDLPDPDIHILQTTFPSSDSPTEYPLYGPQFWNALQNHIAPSGVIATHCGPVAPGQNAYAHRTGLSWIMTMARSSGFTKGCAYHTFIPSYQSEWGFWMSVPPLDNPVFPTSLRVLDCDSQAYSFAWPRHWYHKN